jgi:homoserine O-acetyltransferase
VDNSSLEGLVASLARDPAWNGGDFYGQPGSMVGTMTKLRINTLRNYGLEADLAPRFPDKPARDAEIARIAGEWARAFDPNSQIVLRKAYMRFDVRPGCPRRKARMLFVLSRTDALFPPSIAPAVMDGLRAAGVRVDYVEIDSDRGHLASGLDAGKWAPALRAFLDALPKPA